jgi:hypothetical protein
MPTDSQYNSSAGDIWAHSLLPCEFQGVENSSTVHPTFSNSPTDDRLLQLGAQAPREFAAQQARRYTFSFNL